MARNLPRRPPSPGFTLVEVLVALAIVALALGAGSQAAGALLQNAQRLGDISEAQWCADNQLTALRLARQYPETGESSFECEQLGRRYVGQLLVRPTGLTDFRAVEARISDEQGQVLLSLSTVIGRF
jgi:general secretion pathway protein I